MKSDPELEKILRRVQSKNGAMMTMVGEKVELLVYHARPSVDRMLSQHIPPFNRDVGLTRIRMWGFLRREIE